MPVYVLYIRSANFPVSDVVTLTGKVLAPAGFNLNKAEYTANTTDIVFQIAAVLLQKYTTMMA